MHKDLLSLEFNSVLIYQASFRVCLLYFKFWLTHLLAIIFSWFLENNVIKQQNHVIMYLVHLLMLK